MRLDELKVQYLHYLSARGYAKGTIVYRKLYLEQFFDFLSDKQITQLSQITKQIICEYQLTLSHRSLSPLTIRAKVSTLSCFFTYLVEHHDLIFDPTDAIGSPKRPFYLPKTVLSEEEVHTLLSLPDVHTKRGVRDRAILELLYAAAIRRGELVRVNIYDINLDEATLRVVGKRKKQRITPIGNVAAFWVGKYLRQVRAHMESPSNALFLDLLHKARIKGKHVNFITSEYAKRMDTTKKITPHTLRHTCATHLLQNGADIRHIQEMLGHASVETTQIYTRVAISDLKAVFWKTHPRARKPQ